MTNKTLLVLLTAVMVASTSGQDEKAPLEDTLKDIVKGLISAIEEEDIDKCMEFFHADAPNRAHTKRQYESRFPTHQITLELAEFSYYGHDDKYAVARFSQKMGIVEFNGQPFPDSRKGVIEMMVLFKQNDDAWKIWKSIEIDRESPQ